MKKYVIHPGWVTSKEDGDQHWIGASELCRLYGVPEVECIVFPSFRSYIKTNYQHLTHLYPDPTGEYLLQSVQIEQNENGLKQEHED